MSKTIEEIKEEYAINLVGYSTWDELINDEPSYRVEIHTDQVAQRYAQSQTQEIVELLEHCKSVIHAYNDYRPNATCNEILQAIQDRLTKYNHLKSNTNETDKI